MQTLAERLSDTSKVKLYEGFIKTVFRIASHENLSTNEVYQKWVAYSKQCVGGDQSPVMFEFCQVNGFKEDQVV